MKNLSMLLAGLLGAAVFSAQAGELYSPLQYQDPASTLTRAQVKQEVLKERKAGELQFGDVSAEDRGVVAKAPEFGRTRADVKAETLAASKAGEIQFGDVQPTQVAKGSELTRQQVKAEAIAARQLTRTAPGRNTIDY
jgi:Domain of unknown function (DUF4148)